MDRSTWIQEAASEYLKKRTKEEEVEAWLSAEERMPLTDDELSLLRWNAKHFGEMLGDATPGRKRKTR